MAIADKLTQIANNVPLVYEAGYEKGKAEGGGGMSPFYHATTLAFTFQNAVFPENYEFNLELEKGVPLTSVFEGAVNLKSVKIKSTAKESAVSASSFVRRVSTVDTIDFSEYNTKFTSLNYFAQNAVALKYIYGELDLSECTAIALWVQGCSSLEEIMFKADTINISITFQWCTNISKNSLTSIINGLSASATGQTVTLSLTAVNNAFEGGRDSTEWQTLIATKSNWTIAYA